MNVRSLRISNRHPVVAEPLVLRFGVIDKLHRKLGNVQKLQDLDYFTSSLLQFCRLLKSNTLPLKMPSATTTYGFIGLGQMGHGMAKNIRSRIPPSCVLLICDINEKVV